MSEMSNKTAAGLKPQKVVVPKVWKRPHSTIYGKNVEFGSKLYSDKLGEINGRKFNSELPWQMRNSGSSTSGSSSTISQGYLSKLLSEPQATLIGSVITSSGNSGLNVNNRLRADSELRRPLTPASCTNYADVLELTNPNRYSKRRGGGGGTSNVRLRPAATYLDSDSSHRARAAATAAAAAATGKSGHRIDFYDNLLEFNDEIRRLTESSRLMNEPLMQRRAFDKYLDFNHELGLFVPGSIVSGDDAGRSLTRKRTLHFDDTTGDDTASYYQSTIHRNQPYEHDTDINPAHFNPVVTTTKQTRLLPKHDCQLGDSPYGQSADGRKLSLGSINPHSYRPSLPHKTTTVHASDGEEFELQDRSSPFYTDRWAGRTIRHFDSDLYSNANLFKSMIL